VASTSLNQGHATSQGQLLSLRTRKIIILRSHAVDSDQSTGTSAVTSTGGYIGVMLVKIWQQLLCCATFSKSKQRLMNAAHMHI